VRIRILPDGRRVVVGPDGEPVDAEPASTMPTALDPLPAAPPGFPMPLPEDAPDDEWLPGAPQDDAWLPGAPPVAPPAADPAGLPPMPPPRPEEDAWLPGAPPVAPPAADPAGLPPMPPPRPEEDAWLPGPGTPTAPPPVAPTAPPPVAPTAPEAGEQPPPPPDGDMQFPTAPEADAAGHARKLLSAPGDPRVAGYPAHVVRPAEAAVALEPGHRPAVLLFYDDASRTSDQQAAEFLPVLVAYADRVDVVPIDVTDRDAWSPAEQKLVRTYYMAKVPTTVVLAADRRPVLLKFHRIAAAALESALEKAVGP
jgi:hypothetical protein